MHLPNWVALKLRHAYHLDFSANIVRFTLLRSVAVVFSSPTDSMHQGLCITYSFGSVARYTRNLRKTQRQLRARRAVKGSEWVRSASSGHSVFSALLLLTFLHEVAQSLLYSRL